MKTELLKSELVEKTISVQIAFKKVNTYTSVELVMHFKINSNVKEYWVLRKGKASIKTIIIDEAIERFNSFQDTKDALITALNK